MTKSLYFGTILLMAALYAAMSWFTPQGLDDYVFMANWRDDAGGGYDFSFSTWWRYYEFIRSYDNGRIANAVSPLSTMFSPWREIFPILTGCCVAAIAAMIAPFRPASGEEGGSSFLNLSIAWALMIVCLPWRDTLFVRDYTLNYLFAAVITLAFLYCLFSLLSSYTQTSNVRLGLTLIIAVIAGGWHEGFAVPTLFGLLLMAAARRFRLPGRFYLVLAVYAASTLAFMLSPGLIGRFYNSVSVAHSMGLRNLAAPVILCLVLALRLGQKGLRQVFTLPPGGTAGWGLVFFGIVISGYALGYFTTNTPRSYFWPELACIVLTVRLISYITLVSRNRRKSAYAILPPIRVRIGVGLILISLCTASTVSAIVWQERYRRQYDAVIGALESSPTGTAFYDVTLPSSPPWYTFGMPFGHAWDMEVNYALLQSYFMKPTLGVVPTSLRDTSLPTGSGPVTTKEGHLIAPFDSEVNDSSYIVPKRRGDFLAIPFVSSSDTLIYFNDLHVVSKAR